LTNTSLKLSSFAKINSFLRILGKRPDDGYHELVTLLQTVSLCDEINFQFRDDDQIVPYADSGPLSARLVKDAILKTYKGFPHGMPTTNAEQINADTIVTELLGAVPAES